MIFDKDFEKAAKKGCVIKTYYDLNNYLYGYSKLGDINVIRYHDESLGIILVYKPSINFEIYYNHYFGFYEKKKPNTCKLLGVGGFPYHVSKEYEAIYNLDLFTETSQIKNNIKFNLSKHLNYTMGFEFETACGYVPQEKCFKYGLIPLRDGSISGVEYSSIIIKGNKGLNLLKEQVECMKEHTLFDKECSLHIHFGDYPVNESSIFNLYQLFYYLQSELEYLNPDYSFYTSRFKKSGKDYCKTLDYYDNFNSFFNYITGNEYNGKLYDPHPNDVERERKWNILQRYKFVNFVNMVCYNSPKTIEIRFLRPTYNFKKILLWIYIFNAILKYSEKYTNLKFKSIKQNNFYKYLNRNDISLEKIINEIYEKDADKIMEGIVVLKNIKDTQKFLNDQIGQFVHIDDFYFKDYEIS